MSREMRGKAIMKSKRQSLVFQQQAGVASEKRLQRFLDLDLGLGIRRMDPQAPGCIAAFEAMLPCEWHTQSGQSRFEIRDGAGR
jgi:hypothetical protein